MSSINSNAPPRKLILTVIGAVAGLHVLTAMVLAMVETPSPVAEPLKAMLPIEIQLIAAPVQTDSTKQTDSTETSWVESAENETLENLASSTEAISKLEAKPELKVESETEVKAEPLTKPELEAEPKPELEPEPLEQQTVEPKVSEPEVVIEPKIEPKPVIKSAWELNSGVNTTTQTTIKKAESSTASTTVVETTPNYGGGYTQHSTIPTAPTTSSIANNNESKRIKNEVAKRDTNNISIAQPASAVNNEPVNFNEGDASWAVAPKLSFPSRAERGASAGDTFTVLLALRVNKQGGIDSVRLVQSSGNTALDKEALRQVKTGRFVPFTKDGAPVVGSVTLPIAYKVP